MEDAEFERLQRLMDEAERKDTLVQKLDSVSKLEVRGRGQKGGGSRGRRDRREGVQDGQ